jgi:hypothetical protein
VIPRVCFSPSDEDGNGSHVYANLAESAQYDSDGQQDARDILKAADRFPAMIAAALRKVGAKK